jgi:hypothetical protein
MANQAIALQARAPQADILGGAIRNNAQLINTMAQQRTAERQTAVAQQQMELARLGEERAVATDARTAKKAELDFAASVGEFFRNSLASWAPFGDQAAIQRLRDMTVGMAPALDGVIPQANVLATDRAQYDQAFRTAEQIASARFGKATTSTAVDPDTSEVRSVNTAGEPGYSFSQTNPNIDSLIGQTSTPSATPTRIAPSVAASDEQIDAAAQYLTGNAKASISDPALSGLAPEDLTRAQERAAQMRSGGAMQPISMNTGGQMAGGQGQPDMGAIVQDMFATGVISQSNMNALEQFAGPQKAAQMKQIMQAKNIQIMSDEPAAPVGMSSAVLRSGDGAGMLQQVQYNPRDFPATRAKNPMQSPVPGSVAPAILGAQERAKEQAAAGVKMQTAPKLAADTKTAENRVAKDAAFPDAQSQFDAALSMIDNRLADIERFRKHPAAMRVIGPLDAFTLNTGRARGAQAIYDALVGTATLDALQDMREKSVTGGALGNVSDADIRLLRQSIGALGQDQDETDFNDSLRIHENRLRQTRDRLVQRYRENYSYKLGSKWQPQAPAARGGGGRKVGGFTVMQVED